MISCATRLDPLGDSQWRVGLVRKGLSSDDAIIRDAVLEAADSWEDPAVTPVLIAHNEPEDWLAQYIRDIISA